MRFYPRSFSKLLFVGFALIALPLMFALINNAISIDRLGNQSQNAVYQAVQATQSSRRLAELITAMERTAHQMIILGERSLLDTYARAPQAAARRPSRSSRACPSTPSSAPRCARSCRARRRSTSCSPIPARGRKTLQKAVQAFVGLAERAQAINRRSNELIDREVENMRATARQAQQHHAVAAPRAVSRW